MDTNIPAPTIKILLDPELDRTYSRNMFLCLCHVKFYNSDLRLGIEFDYN